MATGTPHSYHHRPFIILVCCALISCGATTVNQPDQRINTIQKADPSLIRINAVGDIMLGGTAKPILQHRSYHYPFEKIAPLFNDSHIVIGNLEGPLTASETPYADKTYLFKTPADKVAPALKQAGFTIMNLANNHIMDFGEQGLKDTMQALATRQIQYVGAGLNLTQARAGKIIQTGQQKTGFLSYSLTFPSDFWASSNRPGTAFGHERQIRQDIQRLRQQANIVIVSFHWGEEKSTKLRAYQPLLARAAIDAGAAMVIGHHPHVLQAVEHYKNGIILYSLGNFAFGSYSKNARFSVVATVEFSKNKFYSLRLTPINVFNVEVNFQPQILQQQEADRVIEHINRLSSPHNTRLSNQQGVAILHATTHSAANSH